MGMVIRNAQRRWAGPAGVVDARRTERQRGEHSSGGVLRPQPPGAGTPLRSTLRASVIRPAAPGSLFAATGNAQYCPKSSRCSVIVHERMRLCQVQHLDDNS